MRSWFVLGMSAVDTVVREVASQLVKEGRLQHVRTECFSLGTDEFLFPLYHWLSGLGQERFGPEQRIARHVHRLAREYGAQKAVLDVEMVQGWGEHREPYLRYGCTVDLYRAQ
ncbi:MAG: hypothetical protein HC876_19895 [Chloroflexaceae bacterium]|nr:hypothetical protein [Chloroflexaceae bacterium]